LSLVPGFMEDKGAATGGVAHTENIPQGQDGPEIESFIVPHLIKLHTERIQYAVGKSAK